MVKKLQQLNLSEVYPAVLADFNLNTCGDPDCGNFGVAPDFTIPVFKGKNAAQRKQAAAASIPALTTGLGSYTMSSDDHHPRISEVFEYDGDPVGWDDGRSMECGHQRGNGVCDISFSIRLIPLVPATTAYGPRAAALRAPDWCRSGGDRRP